MSAIRDSCDSKEIGLIYSLGFMSAGSTPLTDMAVCILGAVPCHPALQMTVL